MGVLLEYTGRCAIRLATFRDFRATAGSRHHRNLLHPFMEHKTRWVLMHGLRLKDHHPLCQQRIPRIAAATAFLGVPRSSFANVAAVSLTNAGL